MEGVIFPVSRLVPGDIIRLGDGKEIMVNEAGIEVAHGECHVPYTAQAADGGTEERHITYKETDHVTLTSARRIN